MRDDELFSAYQNARVVKNGEAYYRQTFEGKFSTWNLRDGHMAETLGEPRLERAIGVIYLPATERQSHYFEARLSRQFDAVIHLDVTSAVTPLGR